MELNDSYSCVLYGRSLLHIKSLNKPHQKSERLSSDEETSQVSALVTLVRLLQYWTYKQRNLCLF